MFIVIPYLTKEPSIYGIYTVCISISIFLAYADLGFIGAGQKYAAENYARGEREGEIRIVGFTSFILLVFVLLLMILFLYLGVNPQALLKNLDTPNKVSVASELLLILTCFAPVTVLQRMSQMIFGIRLDDYINQRVFCVANLIKILSVLYFFRNGHYLIVEYFLFSQIVNVFSNIISLIIAKNKYKYNFKLLISSMRFDFQIFRKVNKLAFSSLFLTIMWILYYELDTIAIGKFLGAEKVAIYAIGLTMLSFSRGILGILFSPFNARFNHFIGQQNIEGLKNFSLQVVKLTAPVVIIPIIALTLIAKPLVLSWVGVSFVESVGIARFLLICNIFAFISYPVSMLLMAQEKIKQMYVINSIIPIVYWVGIIWSYSFWGLQSFAIFKFLAFMIPMIYYFFYLLKFINISFISLLNKVFKPLVIPIIFLITSLLLINGYLPCAKSKINLLMVIGTTSIIIIGTFLIQYLVSSDIRANSKILLTSFK
jgi:O-antigen/teichoic acid export membrane protein